MTNYRIDAVIGPTDAAVEGYTTDATEARTTTKEAAFESETGLVGAITRAKELYDEAAAYGLPVVHVCVIDGTAIVATVDAEHPNG